MIQRKTTDETIKLSIRLQRNDIVKVYTDDKKELFGKVVRTEIKNVRGIPMEVAILRRCNPVGYLLTTMFLDEYKTLFV